MCVYTQQLQVRVAGPNMLPGVVSVSSCLLHIPRLQAASTAKRWKCVLSPDGLWNSSYKSQGIFSMQQARSAHISDEKFHVAVWSFIWKRRGEVPTEFRSTSNLWFQVSGQPPCFQKALQGPAYTPTNTKIWQQFQRFEKDHSCWWLHLKLQEQIFQAGEKALLGLDTIQCKSHQGEPVQDWDGT